MSELSRYSKDGEIGVITIDNPAAKRVMQAGCEGLAPGAEAIHNQPPLEAAGLLAAGNSIIAGADISMFLRTNTGEGRRINLLPDLLDSENCSKPVIGASHGT